LKKLTCPNILGLLLLLLLNALPLLGIQVLLPAFLRRSSESSPGSEHLRGLALLGGFLASLLGKRTASASLVTFFISAVFFLAGLVAFALKGQ
jgi:hypothetical protein